MRLVVFFSRGMSLAGWQRAGILDRELALYRALQPHLEHLAFLTYGGAEESDLAARIPGVQILAADHPRDPQARRSLLELARPVSVGSNVWIGAAAVVLPGVSVGDDSIIGAGSVVTRDIPSGVVAVGSPCRVVRTL